MAHMIDMSNAQANIAFVGEAPWHRLGTELQPDQPISVWAEKAGLSHAVLSAPAMYRPINDEASDEPRVYTKRNVLYRSDTGAALSVVGQKYKTVQPAEVLSFFDRLTKHNSFTLETAGSLDGGRRIWALARVSDGAPVIGHDLVRPYVLLATSYDGTMATVAKFTTVRVVCHNTLTMSAGYGDQKGEEEPDGTAVRVPHSTSFVADDVRLDLGIVFNAFDRFMLDAKRLSKRQVNEPFAAQLLKMLLPPAVTTTTTGGQRVVTPSNVEDTKPYQQIMALFRGEAMGAGLPEAGGTAWGLLNAVTQYVDHSRGRNDNARLGSAWFGAGDALKTKAHELLLDAIS